MSGNGYSAMNYLMTTGMGLSQQPTQQQPQPQLQQQFSPSAPILPPQVSEDAAGDGGEAVATFSNYNAPTWAKQIQYSKNNTNNNHDNGIAANQDDHTDNKQQQSASVQSSQSRQNHENSHSHSHSSPACESGLLASVSAPEPTNECLTVIRQLASEGKLSPLQVEGAGLAIQRHCRIFTASNTTTKSSSSSAAATNTTTTTHNNINDTNTNRSNNSRHVRAGFFLGDGAGIGKGRQIAAVLRDSFSRSKREKTSTLLLSRRRHLWLSVSRELIEDARRDLEDVGCHVPVIDGAEALGGGNSSSSNMGSNGAATESGVLFITYAFLTTGKGKRMEDIISWLTHGSGSSSGTPGKKSKEEREADFDGCIIFDEAHKAKNLCSDPPTTTGLLVLALQERLSNARVMYCSATGVSDLKQMAYAVRLGLWGPGTNFATFDIFRRSLEKRGVGAMELLALEMKQAGCFVARTLSWDGAEFHSVRATLSPFQIETYDRSMIWWERVKREIQAALARPGMNGTPRMLWSNYWSAHQRFCKELAICAKVPLVVEDSLKQLEMGHSVVIGLQSTGEASTQASLAELQSKLASENKPVTDLEDVVLPGILSTAAAIMAGFVRTHFPVVPLPIEPVKVPTMPPAGFSCEDERQMYLAKVRYAERINNMPQPTEVPELVEKRQMLLDSIQRISLPPAPLDDLIDRLGGVDNVAEMTGRSGRVLRSNDGETFRFVKRVRAPTESKYAFSMPVSEEDMERLNISEKKKFMDGRRKVAIISDAASTGISLHTAEKSVARNRRRVHYTIELPWAADKAIQQLGRTHRSGQVSAPIYKMVVTDLGGERRFAAAVAKRMAALGALTKGDRRAATGSDLSEFDIDSKFGRRALKRLYDSMKAEPPHVPSKGAGVILDVYISDTNDPPSSSSDQNIFERRISVLFKVKEGLEMIGIDDDMMKKGEFASTMDDVINDAKLSGEFEGSVEDIRATSIELAAAPRKITKDLSSGAATKLAIFNVDRGCSLSRAIELFMKVIPPGYPNDKDVEAASRTARSGFYISKRQILGRTLVLFAGRKVRMTVLDEDEAENIIDYDPSGFMILTRPNTGTNHIPMRSDDLLQKYHLVVSVDDLKKHLDGEYSRERALEIVNQKYSSFCNIWEGTYVASDRFAGDDVGLAPRHSKLGLVTGAVLHCLPELEKSISMRNLAERSLKIIRVETSDNDHQQHRLVGMKYPADEAAIENLKTVMKSLEATRSKDGFFSSLFLDESPHPIQAKSVTWITTPPKTMKSFFQTVNGSNNSNSGCGTTSATTANNTAESGRKRGPTLKGSVDKPNPKIPRTTTTTRTSTKKSIAPSKKPKTITSFFKKL